MQGYVPRAFVHDLHAFIPSAAGELALYFQLCQLGKVVRIRDGAGAQAVTDGYGYIIGRQNVTNLIPVGVEEVFLLVEHHPFGNDGTASGYDAGGTACRVVHEALQQRGMYGYIIHTLASLLDEGISENRPAQVLYAATAFLQTLVHGHGANGDGAVAQNPLASFVDVSLPVDKSITVSAPQWIAQRSFSTSCSMPDEMAELPMLALILQRKLRPIIMGSTSGWLMLAGMRARPAAISSRTNSGVKNAGMLPPRVSAGCW